MDIKAKTAAKDFIPDPLKDQFFLIDKVVIADLVNFAEVDKDDVVLEIGAGFGNLTREIAKRAKKVIAFEIDKNFKPYLKSLPKNVELHFEDAWDYVRLHGKFKKKKVFNKVVSNLPYSFCEKFLHNLTFLEYDKVILLVPLKFVNKIKRNGIFSSFFEGDLKEVVDKDKFYPVPRTNSAIIDLLKLKDPLEEKNLALFLRQYIYQHEKQKVKNSIREGLIVFAKQAYNKGLAKNEARKLIAGAELEKNLLDEAPNSNEIYAKISYKFAQRLI
ncbi:MAG: rRNA adenine N-6-methyltransferase family protein [Candidatus Levyibacteriota bacterium]|jgi:16S rRNA (adenine1518-N6/adenine1519-N6)-dimethyltransferase